MAEELHLCAKPDCRRMISLASRYCCGNCATADEGGWELAPWHPGCDHVNFHTQPCEKHREERQVMPSVNSPSWWTQELDDEYHRQRALNRADAAAVADDDLDDEWRPAWTTLDAASEGC